MARRRSCLPVNASTWDGLTRKAVLEEFERARQFRDLGLPVRAGKEPLGRFLRRWLEDCVKARCRPRTYELYKQQVEAHIVPTIGLIPLDKLTPQEIQQRLIAAKLAEGLSGRTVRHVRAAAAFGLVAGREVAAHPAQRRQTDRAAAQDPHGGPHLRPGPGEHVREGL